MVLCGTNNCNTIIVMKNSLSLPLLVSVAGESLRIFSHARAHVCRLHARAQEALAQWLSQELGEPVSVERARQLMQLSLALLSALFFFPLGWPVRITSILWLAWAVRAVDREA